mgnify:FL=1
MERLLELGLQNEKIVVKSDSQLLIYQINGYYSVNAPRIVPLYKRVMKLIEKFSNIRFEWHPREFNEDADNLSRKAYEEHIKNNPDFYKKYTRYLATEKQKNLLNRLKVSYPPWIPKRDASKLIDSILLEKRRRSSSTSSE